MLGNPTFLADTLPFFGLGIKHQEMLGIELLKQHPIFLHSAAEIPG